jgi:hypothetical protein
VRILVAGIPRFPGAGSSARGQSEPKERPKGVFDGQQFNITALRDGVLIDGEGGRLSEGSDGRFLVMEGLICRQIRRSLGLAIAQEPRQTGSSHPRHADEKNP